MAERTVRVKVKVRREPAPARAFRIRLSSLRRLAFAERGWHTFNFYGTNQPSP
jgi:hypothetical protein